MTLNKEFKEEQWLPVVGLERLYEISDCGRIRRIHYKGKPVKMELRPHAHKKGYLVVGLRDYEKRIRKWFLIHRLIAIAFIPNPENKCDVNHKNGVKTDNRLENLEWATRRENIQHSWDLGLSKINIGCFKKGHNRWAGK